MKKLNVRTVKDVKFFTVIADIPKFLKDGTETADSMAVGLDEDKMIVFTKDMDENTVLFNSADDAKDWAERNLSNAANVDAWTICEFNLASSRLIAIETYQK